MDEMYQLKKEVRVNQMETRRMAEEVHQRLSVVDSRIQAGESNLRSLDRREATNTNAGQQGSVDLEMQVREVQAEVARFKRAVEGEVRAVVEAMKSELRQREGVIQQLDASVRGLQLQLKGAEEARMASEREIKTAVERRFEGMQASVTKQEQQIVDRGLALERVLQREADERARGDAMIRQELEQALVVVKNASQKEEAGRLSLHKELRGQIHEVSKAMGDQVRLVREEGDRGRQHILDQAADERLGRETAIEMCQRRVDNFIRLYEVERGRLNAGVKGALEQITQRTHVVQGLAKRMQEEGTELRRIAGRVQDDSSVAVRALGEKLDDGIRSLTATTDRHTQQILDVKSAHTVDTQEIKDRLSQVAFLTIASIARICSLSVA